jgi:hypothetical protein
MGKPVGDGKSLRPTPSMVGGAAMTSLMLPLSGDLLERQRLRSNASAKHTGRCIDTSFSGAP